MFCLQMSLHFTYKKMKTMPKPLSKGKKKSLQLETTPFSFIKTVEEFKEFFTQLQSLGLRGPYSCPGLPAPAWQGWQLPGLQSKAQNHLDGGLHERRIVQRLKPGFHKECWNCKRRQYYFFPIASIEKKKPILCFLCHETGALTVCFKDTSLFVF